MVVSITIGYEIIVFDAISLHLIRLYCSFVSPGGVLPKSLTVRYKYIDEMREMKLVVPDDGSSKQAMAWLKAMEKVLISCFNLMQQKFLLPH